MKRSVFVLLAVLACGGGSKTVRPTGDETPSWVSQGTGAVDAEGGKRLQAVGSASGPDAKARRQQADAATRTQLDGALARLSAALAKMSDAKQSGDEIAGLAGKAAADARQIRDHWVTRDGTETALEVLDLASFKASLQSVDGDDKLKREMSANADKAFDQLKGH
jgi:hypothetical protein